MATFGRKLEHLTGAAIDRGILDESTARALVSLAEEREREEGVLNLAVILGGLGGAVIALGIILLVASNWQAIGGGVKIAGLLTLLAGAHAGGYWLGRAARPAPRVAAALHFVGAGLFLAGVGLIAQIYQLDSRPPNGILLWLVAIGPLAVLLRSESITLMAVFAFFLWTHMEATYAASPVAMHSFAGFLLLEVGIGIGLLGMSTVVRPAEPSIARVLRGSGILLLAYVLFVLGFYRYFGMDAPSTSTAGPWVLPGAALIAGVAGLTVGWTRIAPESAWLRDRLNTLLLVLLVTAVIAVAADLGAFPQGPSFWFFSFGAGQHFSLVEMLVSVSAWVLWFLIAIWCVAFGTRAGRRNYVNAGVMGVGVGVATRFFDLIGGQAETGMLFVVGGTVLLVIAWATERWRRSVIIRMQEAG